MNRGEQMKLYWGDLHNHCGITYGYGSLENALKAAKLQLDFCTVTPHAMWPDIPPVTPASAYLVGYHKEGFAKIATNWEAVKAIIEASNEEGEFLTFHSFEMHSSKYGDHHIVSPNSELQLLYADSPQEAASGQTVSAIAVPHHIAYTPGYRGINWQAFDEKLSPLVEVYSKHGCGLKDDAEYPYLHTMGPRDSRNTAYAGLRAGHRFSFVASTDHHAGFPGSYGDGKLAVLAAEKTRMSIWDALQSGRTYAVTGDKINCSFTLNNAPFGSKLPMTGKRHIAWRVEGADALDRVVIYKNLKPVHVLSGEELTASETGPYKIRLELGWGDEPDAFLWETLTSVKGGAILDVETCIRGRSILAPSPSQKQDPDINHIHAEVLRIGDHQVRFDCDTFRNISTLHPQTSSVVLTVEGSTNTELAFHINNREFNCRIADLLSGSRTGQVGDYASPSFRIHRAITPAEYAAGGHWEETDDKAGFYHMEVRQRNGSAAYVSPIYLMS